MRPGAQRIGSENFVTYNSTTRDHRAGYATAGLDDVAFENPDGSKLLLAHNNARRPDRFAVDWHRSRTVSSALPEASSGAVGLNARLNTASVWPVSVRSRVPFAAFQSWMFRSSPPDARVLPLESNATAYTADAA